MTKRKKILIIFLLIILVFQSSFLFLFRPKETKALIQPSISYDIPSLPVTVPTYGAGIPVTDIGMQTQTIWSRIWDYIKKAAVSQITISSIDMFANRLAYNLAVALAKGFQGQKPLFYIKRYWKDYLKDAGGAAAGEFLGRLSEAKWNKIGFDFCEPSFPSTKLKLTLGLAIQAEKPIPKCEWQDIDRNWRAFCSQATSGEFLKNFQLEFQRNSELGLGLRLTTRWAEWQAEEKRYATYDRLKSDFRPIAHRISKIIGTPSKVVEEYAKQLVRIGEHKFTLKTETQLAYKDIPLRVFSTFVQTLAGKLLEHTMERGLWSAYSLIERGTGAGSWGSLTRGRGLRRPRPEVEAIFADLLVTKIQPGGEIDIVSQFSVCPANREYASSYNCVIDSGFAEAIRRKLTIREAIEKGYLHGEWLVAQPGLPDGPDDYLQRYSLTNIKKLREAMIVPLGLEIAARLINSGQTPYQQVSLNEIVSHYHNAHYNPADPSTDIPDSPWWHLVDPDWVLAAPITRCAARVNGPIPLTKETGERREECVALQTCLRRSAAGVCTSWGYCTKAKLGFDFEADPCPSYYATCQTYTREKDNQTFSFIKNTLDFSKCNENNYGCQWYSLSQNDEGEWQEGERIYLNHNVQECDAHNDGCSHFIRLRDSEGNLLSPEELNSVISSVQSAYPEETYGDYGTVENFYLKKAPDYYHCYDDDSENDSPFCSQYAAKCSRKDVGCQKYTPLKGGPWVPGVATDKDYCFAECDGYQSFLQEPLWWDSANEEGIYKTDGFVNLIPKTAKKCSASVVGCEEYTNLDEVAAGGEGKEYYSYVKSCQRPENSLCKSYYTWEGNDRVGYQLKEYKLISFSGGPPCIQIENSSGSVTSATCARGAVGEDSCYMGVCSEDGSLGCNNDADCGGAGFCLLGVNPDCFEFYDEEGHIYHALKSKTITCAEDCHPYRKTPVDVTGDGIFDKNDCPAGHWNEATHSCLFTLIPSEGRVCSANDVGCREYRGNAFGNIQEIFKDNFEEEGFEKWDCSESDCHISTESVYLGGYSLWTAGRVKRDVSSLIKNDKAYILTFLAKAKNSRTKLNKIYFNNAPTSRDYFDTNLSLSTDWQVYNVGPIYSGNWGDETTSLIFRASGEVFLDNVVLKEVKDDLFLIANSWTIPASCDTPYPGAMLNCQGYKNLYNQQVYLKSFTRLCSEDKVGCQALIDTYNSSSPKKEEFNKDNEEPIDDLTVPQDKLVYLVVRKDKLCQSKFKGCTALGKPTLDPLNKVESYENLYLINNPDKYISQEGNPIEQPILCQASEQGCEKFIDSQGGISYFVDPGNHTCEYLENVELRTGEYVNGWFISGLVDRDNYLVPCGARETGDGVFSGGDYTRLKKAGEANYQGWVGLCPGEYNLCTEFIDPISLTCQGGERDGKTCQNDSQCPGGRCLGSSVYYIRNEKLLNNDCNGQVSRAKGCFLFLDTSLKDSSGNIVAYWNAQKTYNLSQLRNNDLVNPVSCGPPSPTSFLNIFFKTARAGEISPSPPPVGECYNNANIILKKSDVHRDCAEWLACRSWHYEWDENSSQFKKICTELGRCQKLDDSGQGCAPDGWVDSSNVDKVCESQNDCGDQVKTGLVCIQQSPAHSETKRCTPENLQAWAYAHRQINQNIFGAEYSGYSLFGVYPLDLLQVEKYEDGNYYLTHFTKYPFTLSSGEKIHNLGAGYRVDQQQNMPCTLTEEAVDEDGEDDFISDDCPGAMTCYQPGCKVSLQGKCFLNGFQWSACETDADCQPKITGMVCRKDPDPRSSIKHCVFPKSCRGFPEKDSPYPLETEYSKVNRCQVPTDSENIVPQYDFEKGCQCNYLKVKYGDYHYRYYPLSDVQPPIGVCTSGDKEKLGEECENPCDCCLGPVENGICKGTNNVPTCSYKQGEATYYGWSGYCLEPEISRGLLYPTNRPTSCLTWWPVDLSVGDADIYNQHFDSGYVTSADNRWYCLGETGEIELKGDDNFWRCGHTPSNDFDKNFDINIEPSNKAYVCNGAGGPFYFNGNPEQDPFRKLAIPKEAIKNIKITLGATQACKHCSNGDQPPGWLPSVVPVAKDTNLTGQPPIAVRFTLCEEECDKVWRKKGKNSYQVLTDSQGNWLACLAEDAECRLEWHNWCNSNNNVDDDESDTGEDGANHWSKEGTCMAVKVVFDEDGYLAGLDFNAYGGGGSGEGTVAFRDIVITLRNGCEYVVNTDSFPDEPRGLTKALTNRLWLESWYFKNKGGDTQCVPYGAIGQGEESVKHFVPIDWEEGCHPGRASVAYKLGEDNLLKELFAQVYEVRELDRTTLTYHKVDSQAWDERGIEGHFPPSPPKIASFPNNREGKFSINGIDNGNVILRNGLANLQFYAWADKNHLPIRSVMVDWGDGSNFGGISEMLGRNHKKHCQKRVCTTEQGKRSEIPEEIPCETDTDCEDEGDYTHCEIKDFGETSNACEERYWQFSHFYQCRENDEHYYSTCPISEVEGPCCLYQPKVYVKDNWDWCIGTCDYLDSGGCFGEFCKENDSTNWLPFGHRKRILDFLGRPIYVFVPNWVVVPW